MSLDPQHLQQQAIRLIEPLIPSDAQERVARTVRQFNQIVREHIRSETGLRLSDEKGKGSVSVQIVDGFPAGIVNLINRFQNRTLWRLIIAQPKLVNAVEGLNLLLKNWDEFERWEDLPKIARGSKPSLENAAAVAAALQDLAESRKVFDQLKTINEDILGVYRFGGVFSPRIEIFWMAQALFAGAFGVRIEDLAVVTLAHELAHAYTHIGKDIDGESWKEPGFGASDLHVIEGLAQHYAEATARKLLMRAPGVHPAFEKILEHQSKPYHAHKEWLKDSEQRGETIRFAMLRARSKGKIVHGDWLAILDETTKTLNA